MATRSHSQCGHQKLHWKLDSECWPNCTTLRITLQFCFVFCKMHFRFHFSGVCDLEYYYHFAVFNIHLRRKLGWPQSPLTGYIFCGTNFLQGYKFPGGIQISWRDTKFWKGYIFGWYNFILQISSRHTYLRVQISQLWTPISRRDTQ